MSVVPGTDDGRTVEAGALRLHVRPGQSTALLESADGAAWADLRLLASVDALDAPDETTWIAGPDLVESGEGVSLAWRLGSSRWRAKRIVAECSDVGIDLRVEVEGRGRLTDVSLVGGRAALANGSTGFFSSRPFFGTLLCPSPADPGRVVQPAAESIDISVAGGPEAGRGQWFFTPAPFCYLGNRATVGDAARLPPGPWLTLGLAARPDDARFVSFGWRARERGFHLLLDYEGHTEVDGQWRSPSLVVASADDPYAGLATYREALASRGLIPPAARPASSRPDWWREPIFCGWGAQCALARGQGRSLAAAPAEATERNYEAFLGHLEAHGVVPGTIVVDDKWQAAYGTCLPDPDKWPDLRGWIERRRARGQRVLLWWKAWELEGLPAEACVVTADGRPVAVDPDHAAGRSAVAAAVRSMLSPEGLDADGLKIDFTARTPSGASLAPRGRAWGVALLRRLLEVVHDEARRVKPDALLIGHAPEPATAASLDMIRLNDLLRLDDPGPPPSIVAQMVHRAAIVRAACPDHLVDTDDWCAPNRLAWRKYTERKPSLGVPALYYATHLDLTGEALTDADYDLLRRTWADYRRREGLPDRPAGIPLAAGRTR